MLNIISHQRNTNQNHNEILLISIRMTKIKKKTIMNADKDAEKLDHSYIAVGNIKWFD